MHAPMHSSCAEFPFVLKSPGSRSHERHRSNLILKLIRLIIRLRIFNGIRIGLECLTENVLELELELLDLLARTNSFIDTV